MTDTATWLKTYLQALAAHPASTAVRALPVPSLALEGAERSRANPLSLRQVIEQHPRILVVGAPGAGKTTSLLQSAVQLADAYRWDVRGAKTKTQLVPLFVDMARFRDSIEQTIVDVYGVPMPPTWRELTPLSLVFYLDGLEQLPTETQLTALSHVAALMSTIGPQARWVMACRSEALALFRPWFSTAEVRSIRPLTTKDIVAAVREYADDAWVSALEHDSAVIALASRPRWVTALRAVLQAGTVGASAVRSRFLWAWLSATLTAADAEPAPALALLRTLHQQFGEQSDTWALVDVVLRLGVTGPSHATVAQQLLGAPADSPDVAALRDLVAAGILTYDYEHQALTYRHPLIRSAVRAQHWLTRPAAEWTLAQVTSDDDALSIAVDLSDNQPAVLRRLFELGLVRPAVKAILQGGEPERIDTLLQSAGVKTASMRIAVADILQQEGAVVQARAQLEGISGDQRRDADVLRRIAELAVTQSDWPAAVEAYELLCALRPDDLAARRQLGTAYSNTGAYDAAAQSLHALIGIYRRQGASVAHELGVIALRQQDYPAALKAFDQALAEIHDDPGLYRAKGQALEALQRYDDAYAVLQGALGRLGDHPDILAALGRVCHTRGDHTNALYYLEKAVTLAPLDAYSHATLGRVKTALGDLRGAVLAHQRAVELNPVDEELYIAYGNALAALGDGSAAIDALRTAVTIAPKSITAQRQLAKHLQTHGESDEALQIIRGALVSASTDAALQSDLAGLLWQRGEYDTALATYRKAISLTPQQSTHMHTMAKALVDIGRFREAAETYNTAIGIDGDNVGLLVDAVHVYEQLGQIEQGDALIQRALIHHGDDTRLLRTAAGFALRRGRTKRARSYLAKAVWLGRHDATTWLHVAQLHLAEKAWPAAIRAVRHVPDATHNSAALELLGQAYAGAGRYEEATRTFEQAIRANPESAGTLVAYSKAMAGNGRADFAYEQARKAYLIDATDVEVLLQMARMALVTDRVGEALEVLDSAALHAPQRVDVLSLQSKALLRHGLFDRAVQVARTALQFDPQSIDALIATAAALLGIQRHHEARDFYVQASKIDPQHPDVLAGLRDAAMLVDDFSTAADAAQRLVALAPKSAEHHLRLGEVLIAIGVPEAAIIELQQALDLDRNAPAAKRAAHPLRGTAYAQMSAAYAKSARWSEARECAEHAVAADDTLPEHHALLGDAHLGLGQRVAAVTSYRNAVRLRPDHAGWQFLFGHLLHETGADREAVAALRKAVTLDERPEYYHMLGLAHLALGETKPAVNAIEQALQLRPEAHHWRADLADVHAQRGWYKEAINEIDRALDIAGDHPALWRKRAELLLRNDQVADASTDILEALRRDGNDVKSLTLMSQIMLEADSVERALEAAERAVSVQPDDAHARHQLAAVFTTLGRDGEAIPHLIAALRLRDHQADWWVELADNYENVRDIANAAQCMARAVALLPQDINYAYRYGYLAFQIGDLDNAEAYLKRVVAAMPNSAPAIACQAEVALARGYLGEAHNMARRAVDIQGQVSEHWRVYARVLRSQGDLTKALAAARTAHELEPDYAPSALIYGLLLLDHERIDDAVPVFSAAVQADPSQAIYHMCLGMALRQQVPLAKDFDEFVVLSHEAHLKITAALQSFERALMLEGDNPRYFFEYGIALQMLERHAEAVSTFDAAAALQGDVHPRPLSGDAAEASTLDKNDLAAHIRQRRALSLAFIGRPADAVADMRYVLAVAPLSMHDQYLYGRVAYLAGLYAEALAALAHAAASMPTTAVVQQWYGMLLLKLGQIREATPVLERANELLPGNGPINAALRDAYIAEERFDRAMSAASRATRFESGNPDNHYQLAKLYLQAHRYREARGAVMAAIALKNDVVAWHMLLGEVCVQMGMFDNARSAYLSATALDPDGTKPLYALSHLLVLQGRVNEAITHLEQAVLRDPENARWHYELGQLYEQRGDRQRAADAYRRAVQYGGDKAQYYRELAALESKMTPTIADPTPVVEEIQRSAHRFSSDVEVFLAMGDVNFAQKRYDAALEQFNSAAAVAPHDVAVLWRVGNASYALGLVSDARAAFESALKRDRHCVQAHAGLARIAQHEKQFQLALDHLRIAAELEPHAVAHKIDMCETLLALKKPDECQVLFPQVLKILPADVGILQRFAVIAMALGNTPEALHALEQAVSIDDGNADSHCLLGRAAKMAGNAQRAQHSYRRAVAINPDLKEAQQALSILGPLSLLRRRHPPKL